MSDEKRAAIIELIREAFADVRLPEDDPVFIPSAAYYNDRIDQASAALKALRWQDVPLALLIENRDRLSLLTDPAWYAFLPAFLLAIIEYPWEVDVLVDNLLANLVPPDPQALYQARFMDRVGLLNSPQARAILRFFEAYTDLYPPEKWSYTEDDHARIEQAMTFWKSHL